MPTLKAFIQRKLKIQFLCIVCILCTRSVAAVAVKTKSLRGCSFSLSWCFHLVTCLKSRHLWAALLCPRVYSLGSWSCQSNVFTHALQGFATYIISKWNVFVSKIDIPIKGNSALSEGAAAAGESEELTADHLQEVRGISMAFQK